MDRHDRGLSVSQHLLDWCPHSYRSCKIYFLHTGQYSASVRGLCELINIQLPYQKATFIQRFLGWIIEGSQTISLIPYLDRLICTGQDTDATLAEFFGDGWSRGISVLHKEQRQTYLKTAKSTDYASVKSVYDIGSQETVPHMVPLREATEEEIQTAERGWSEWLAMQDWEIGPRFPNSLK